MRKNPTDPGQSDQPAPVSRGQVKTRRVHVRFTPAHAIIGVLALTLLLLSALASLINTTSSQASTNGVLDTCPATPTVTATTGSGVTATATTITRKTPTPTNTPTPTPTPTNTPTPTPTPTDTPTPTATASGTAGTSGSFAPNGDKVVLFSALVTCSPTATATSSDTQTPDAGTTATSTTVPTGNPGGNTTSNQSSGGSGGGSRVVVIVGGVVALLLLGLLVGWFFFRRMLLPQGAANASLPPSGARPWSRTRMPNPDSMGGLTAVQAGNPGFGGPGAPGGPAGSHPNMFADAFQGPPMNNQGFNGPGPQGGNNGMGFGFSDGFVSPSQQFFPQGENSMIPPGSGAFPVIGNANGFTPASPAFNAMYGLPDDPFSGSQAGSPGWMANLGNGGPGAQAPAGQSNFAPGQVDLNDPELADIIRQYSQKSQSVKTQSVQPPQQQNPPNGPPQQMPPKRPQQQQPPSIPQREPRKGFQDSHWLQ